MLTNGLAASDVNGESVPSGFSRIDAFRIGVLGDEDRVLQALPVNPCANVVGRLLDLLGRAVVGQDRRRTWSVDRVRNA